MKPNPWPKLRKILAKYLTPGCLEDGSTFERELAPFFGQVMFPSVGHPGFSFVPEGIRVAAPSDMSGSVLNAYLIGTGYYRKDTVISVRKGARCWLCSTAEPIDLILRKNRTLYRALSPGLVAQILAEEMVADDEITES